MRLAEVGEFGLIDRLARIVHSSSSRILLGIGDDAALVHHRDGYDSVLTTDALIEGIHFDLSYTPLESLGWKALAVNLSDIAAMGGSPLCATVAMAVPESWSVENVETLYLGLAKCGKIYRCPTVGGDTVRSLSGCFISVTVEGEVRSGMAILRSGASVGDVLCVTGTLGGARTGLEILSHGVKKKRFSKSVQRFLEPVPRLNEMAELGCQLPITSMIDISDGLVSEIYHLCEQSHVGCLIHEDRIPLADEAFQWAKENNAPISRYIYESGEEYELLFTVSKSAVENEEQFNRILRRCNVTLIGEITKYNQGIRVLSAGKNMALALKRWDHFFEQSQA